VLTGGVSACGGDDSSGEAGGPDGTALPTVKPQKAESAQRFIRRGRRRDTHAEHRSDGGVPRDGKDCAGCRHLARTIRGYYAAGGHVRTAGWRIDSIDATPSATGVVTYYVTAQAAPMTVQESSSAAVEHIPGRPVNYLISVLVRPGSFTVTSRTLA
jgi:hypothetical protein